MKKINFSMIANDAVNVSLNSFASFNEGSVCDMCWGDLSL